VPFGSGKAQERGIVGETPNLAARLQGIAEPNIVVIAEGTRRILGSLFELEDLGANNLKGVAEPVRAWAALRPNTVASRFEALHASGLTELVGREEDSTVCENSRPIAAPICATSKSQPCLPRPRFVASRSSLPLDDEPPAAVDQNLLALDESLVLLIGSCTFWASSGSPNAVFWLTPDDLKRLTGAEFAGVKA
jgi:hypothetical protein